MIIIGTAALLFLPETKPDRKYPAGFTVLLLLVTEKLQLLFAFVLGDLLPPFLLEVTHFAVPVV